eukprot:11708877-Alexandrium_andersonii.AAC.1
MGHQVNPSCTAVTTMLVRSRRSPDALRRLPGGCQGSAWRVPGGCLAGAWRVPGGCLEGAWR